MTGSPAASATESHIAVNGDPAQNDRCDHSEVSMALLEIKDLETCFRTPGGDVHAVDGVSFEVRGGETLGLVGESGCGKSVTALSIMQLVPEPAGEVVGGSITFDGTDLRTLSDREIRALRGNDLAMIFQDPMTSLNPVLTIGRQISEVLRLHLDMSKAKARQRSIELLELVGIPKASERLDDYPHQFSGGMRQRAMVAMAIACNPRLILADEITTALDVTIQAQILQLLKRLSSEMQTAFVLITHDLGIVAGMTDRVCVMYAGQIVETATTAELYRNPNMPYTWGLLASLPRLDRAKADKLVPIPGVPPDLIEPPTGCRFEARCRFRREICSERVPALLPAVGAEPEHLVRCWGTQDVAGGGWLIGLDWEAELARAVEADPLGDEVFAAPDDTHGTSHPETRTEVPDVN